MIVLGIESSCDETAAAVVDGHNRILSSVIASQVDAHRPYGGVVPELASRMHVQAITPVVTRAMDEANLSIQDIDGVAATRGPGLVGALLVGFTFAKAFAWAKNLPFAGVNHLEAHIHSLLLCRPAPEFPFIALVVSGGHTNIYHVVSDNRFELMGQTRDDAAGEAFDKVAKTLGLGYPGGPVIEAMARDRDPGDIVFPRSLLEKGSFDFSFSGLKSAVARYVHEHPVQTRDDKARVAAAFQAAVVDVVCEKLVAAAQSRHCRQIGISGGVSANQTLVAALTRRAARYQIEVIAPPVSLCGDNAAMVAARGAVMIRDGHLCGLDKDVFSRALNLSA
ncbi:tRNA (adenosine(37)-N6)-threonylcarbamoyltransferase complex transferase subunit TsaD [Desulfotignum phosphitoxidans]|uniref:tRNA N6-adenosine threonylcarbamoyltransferase n=1 Tax=Desulfotignum phosphitoxidans DSM 13687 TaxID=1286635 RepID=S0FVP3_9BACT|nr:tRNA (adenosine(37)-N6)-threonylcarbamoyltransferase complex transferase subunit TsaD [Desulfotignum phosphitoxidans]EMS78780.1 gcp tRNA threonylcarbamoyladenosine biosynthesis protein Gcp [Desulfotignum phosphitoxidans DSM 13687]